MPLLKRVLSILFRISSSIALLIFLFSQVDRKSLLVIIKNSDKVLLSLAFFVFLFNYLFCFARWEMFLKAIKINLPFRRVVISAAGGVFFSLFLPSTIGGDLVRSLDLSLYTRRPREVVTTVLLDRLSGYAGLVLVSLFAVAFGWRYVQDVTVLFPVVLISAVLVGILLALFNRTAYSVINRFLYPSVSSEKAKGLSVIAKLRASLKNLHHEMYIFRRHKRILFYNVLISILVQAVFPLSFYLIALSLGIRLNIIYFFVYLPIIGAITLLPISIGGLGLRDATTIYFFAKAGITKDPAFAMSLLSFAFILIYGVLGGLIYVFTLHHRRLQYHKPPSLQTTHQ